MTSRDIDDDIVDHIDDHIVDHIDDDIDDVAGEDFYPEFAIVRRGYDPDQVERVLDELYTSLDAAIRESDRRGLALAELRRESAARAQEETRAPEPATFANLGTHIAQILDEAASEAAETRSRAERDCGNLLAEAEAEAERIRREARDVLDAANRARLTLRRELADVKGRIVEALQDPSRDVGPEPSPPPEVPAGRGVDPVVEVDRLTDQTERPSVSDHSVDP